MNIPAKLFGVPVVHSTVNVAGGQKPTIPELAELLKNDEPLDRTTVNSWEDIDFVQAVHATGRRKLIFCALWTEVCMATAMRATSPDGPRLRGPVTTRAGRTSHQLVP